MTNMQGPAIVAVAVLLALPLALTLALSVPMSPPAHPPRCGEVTGIGSFCVSFDPGLGRYENPPPGVPADFSRVDPADLVPFDFRPLLAALLFLALAPSIWWVLSRWSARPRYVE